MSIQKRDWERYTRRFLTMGERIRGEGRVKEGLEVAYPRDGKPMDWLAYAISALGGPTAAGKSIGVDRLTIYKWLENGLNGAKFGSVIALAREANIPLEYLAQRKGPFVELNNGAHA